MARAFKERGQISETVFEPIEYVLDISLDRVIAEAEKGKEREI
jgi:hypothetical protein